MMEEFSKMLSNGSFMQIALMPRDVFAAAIAMGMHANPELMQFITKDGIENGSYAKKMAETAYNFADAMMSEKKVRDDRTTKEMADAMSSIMGAFSTDKRD